MGGAGCGSRCFVCLEFFVFCVSGLVFCNGWFCYHQTILCVPLFFPAFSSFFLCFRWLSRCVVGMMTYAAWALQQLVILCLGVDSFDARTIASDAQERGGGVVCSEQSGELTRLYPPRVDYHKRGKGKYDCDTQPSLDLGVLDSTNPKQQKKRERGTQNNKHPLRAWSPTGISRTFEYRLAVSIVITEFYVR